MIAVVVVAVITGALMVLSFVWSRRRPAEPSARALEFATTARPTGVRVDARPDVRTVERAGQCPRCGRYTEGGQGPDHRCDWCGLMFQAQASAPWPDVTLCLWLPRTHPASSKENL